jgi:Ca2+-binding EF-hand superfamily protein
MNTRTLAAAVLASVVAATAVAPALAAGDPVKQEKRMHRMLKRVDTNKDGRISTAEMDAALSKSFAVFDTNHDGVLSKAEVENRRATFKAYREDLRAERKAGRPVVGVVGLPKAVDKHFARIDANRDGVLSKAELASVAQRLFQHRDHNRDGYISTADLKA